MRRASLGQRGVHSRAPKQERRLEEQPRLRRLAECSVPEGMALVTLRPRQAVRDGQVCWVFVLRFDVGPGDCWFHEARFEAGIGEEVLMHWAVRDFVRELMDEGIRVPNAEVWLSVEVDE